MLRQSLHLHSWRNTSSLRRLIVIVALLCLGFGLVAAPAASAHDQLISSNPTDGQRLSVAPPTIKIAFSSQLLTLGYEIRIVDADSKNWAQGAAILTQDSLSQPLAASMPDGEYQVRWRVVSSDGHPINGSFSFLVGENAQSASIPKATSQETTIALTIGTDEPARSSVPAWGVTALFGAGAGLALYLSYLYVSSRLSVSSRRRRSDAGQD